MTHGRLRKVISASALLLGVAVIGYIGGAAAMYYRLPSSTSLTNAFRGASFWHRRNVAAKPSQQAPAGAKPPKREVDRPDKTFDGFTLYTHVAGKELGTQALLIDMRGRLVHRWSIAFSEVRQAAGRFGPSDASVCFFGSYLYPNGDLLVVFHGWDGRHCGLAKLDANSHLLWFCPRPIHHDVDVAEDGTIYAIEKVTSHDLPPGLQRVPVPCLTDNLLALSADGELMREPKSIVAAFCDSPYAALLEALERPGRPHQPPADSTAPRIAREVLNADLFEPRELLHTNCVRVFPSRLAREFPFFTPGHVLISVRNLSAIAMLDPLAGRVEWAARGDWLAQHDPQFLENGRLLIFDNLGVPKGSRVLEYDPQTQSLPWSYPTAGGSDFYTSERGMNQRLPNGNTFIVNSEGGELFEVDDSGEIVWSFYVGRFVTSARRFAPQELLFLDRGIRARP